ncbi:hypothetical protein [Metasolibacillus sp. FSL K6-0083]
MFIPFLKEAFSVYMNILRNIIATVQNAGYARLFGQPHFYIKVGVTQ